MVELKSSLGTRVLFYGLKLFFKDVDVRERLVWLKIKGILLGALSNGSFLEVSSKWIK